MTKAALIVFVIEVLAACILLHRVLRIVGKGIAAHRTQAGSAGLPR